VINERFMLRSSIGGSSSTVQRVRLRADEIDDTVDAVRSFMRVTGSTIAGWWLSELSTPADVEQRLLARGLRMVDGDHLVDGMLLTEAPPPGPADVAVRAIETADEYVAVTETQYDAFDTALDRRREVAQLVEAFELDRQGGVAVTYAAWVDGRVAGGARSILTPRSVLLSGGATAPWARGRGAYRALVRARWEDAAERGTPALAVQAGSMSAPILRRLGFEKVMQFRRIEDVASTP
jgi:hypothetical protein